MPTRVHSNAAVAVAVTAPARLHMAQHVGGEVDAVHAHLMNNPPPVDLNGAVLYHCGPVMLKQGEEWFVKAAGPTTSSRERFVAAGEVGDVADHEPADAAPAEGGMQEGDHRLFVGEPALPEHFSEELMADGEKF